MAINSAAQISYFQSSVGTLSAAGIHNVLVGLLIAGIINGLPFLLLVPLVTSAASALANGLCYYTFFTDYAVLNRAVAAGFMDTFWLIQEAGLPFYGYAILTTILHGGELRLYRAIFWMLMIVTLAVRIVTTVFDVQYIVDPNAMPDYNNTVDLLHIGYFVPIALAECLTAFFLLRKFRRQWQISKTFAMKAGMLYHYLTRSTEIRVSMLAIIGIWRTITFSTHTLGHEDGVASQFDQFAYMLVTFFPVIMYVDILASRLVYADGTSQRSSNLNAIPTSQNVSSNSSSNPQSKLIRGSQSGVAVTEPDDAHRDAEDVLYGWTDRQWSRSSRGGGKTIEPKIEPKINETNLNEAKSSEG